MAYHCIPLSAKDYKLTLERVLDHPTRSKKYAFFSDQYDFLAQATQKLQALGPNKHLPPLLEQLCADQKSCQEGMAKLLDADYRAMQRQAKSSI